MVDPQELHEEAVGVETEVGATSGKDHDDLLIQTLGREYGLRVAISDGPPPPRRKK